MNILLKTALLTGIFCIFLSCSSFCPDKLILLDFETDKELDTFFWKCKTLFSLSDKHITHGKKSLKIIFFPSKYPGLSFKSDKNDWTAFSYVNFDIYNTKNHKIAVTVRIDDNKSRNDFNNRFNKKITIKPGINNVRIPLKKLITSDKKRLLNLKKISSLYIFISDPSKKIILYIDYIRLESSTKTEKNTFGVD